MKPSDPVSRDSTTSVPDLPPDPFLVIRDHLITNHRQGTAGKLMTCSKAFYELFEPVIRYTSLAVSIDNKAKHFWGLTGCECSCPDPCLWLSVLT